MKSSVHYVLHCTKARGRPPLHQDPDWGLPPDSGRPSQTLRSEVAHASVPQGILNQHQALLASLSSINVTPLPVHQNCFCIAAGLVDQYHHWQLGLRPCWLGTTAAFCNICCSAIAAVTLIDLQDLVVVTNVLRNSSCLKFCIGCLVHHKLWFEAC